MSENVLELHDLRITYQTQGGGVPAVRGVNLTVGTGEVLGLAGESGCGKSTIAGAILRLLPPSTTVEGQIILDGQDMLVALARASSAPCAGPAPRSCSRARSTR